MIAFGTLKKKAAFKLYARAKNMDFTLANTISDQIAKYDEAVKYADDDDKDLIDINDYVDIQYQDYLKQSEEYWGIIADKKKAPSAYLLYQGNIRKEIGLIKCKSESTKREYLTCVIDGAIAENYKFLKNDILKVDSVLLIDKVFKRIGIEPFNVNTLINNIADNKSVWDLYANGYTIGINQVEQDGSRHKCMRYKPTNVSELSAFIAAIRPGFKSMYQRFENRENFAWGINALDNLLRTKELPVSFLFFQEQVMSVLNYAGFPMDQCYSIIKAIAKKHPEKVKPLKAQFLIGFKQKLIQDEHLNEENAQKYSENVWQIINDNCNYSFNASHAYCMALDSLYQAWQKATYPYEFYEVNLQHFTDKGKKDKVARLKTEMKEAFNINEGLCRFGIDNRTFKADSEHHCIYPALSSIKGLSAQVAEDLFDIYRPDFHSFIEVLQALQTTSIDNNQLNTLIKLDYFHNFGDINQLLFTVELFNNLYNKKVLSVDKLSTMHIPLYIAQKYCAKQTAKQFRDFDALQLINAVLQATSIPKIKIVEKLKFEFDLLGYISTILPTLQPDYYYVQGLEKGKIILYQLCSGHILKIKIRANVLKSNPVNVNNIIKIIETKYDGRWAKDENGNWIQLNETEQILNRYSVLE